MYKDRSITIITTSALQKKFRFDAYDKSALAIIALAVGVRLFLLALGWPQTDSDEGTMGLMALHIAYHGKFPLVFYGQNYLGTLEAYLAAAFFLLFGPSLFTLRLSVIVLFALFLLSIYLLVCLLYSKPLAILSLVILGGGADEIVFRQLEAVGGAPDVLFFGAALLLLTSWLALSSSSQSFATSFPKKQRSFFSVLHRSKRSMAYTTWGILAGLAIWSDPLVLPFIGMAGMLLALCCHQELKSHRLTLLFLGMIVGLAPWIVYLATVPPSPDRLTLVPALTGPGYHEPIYPISSAHSNLTAPSLQPSLALQVEGTVLVSLPIATSGNTLCPLSPSQIWPVHDDTHTILCTSIHGTWGIAYIVLWGSAALLALRSFWHYWRKRHILEKRQAAIRQAARLMILGSAGGTLLLYALFPPAALTPLASSRYLVGVLIGIPAVLFPLWSGFSSQKSTVMKLKRVFQASRSMVIVFIYLVWLLGIITVFQLVPQIQAVNQQQQSLIEHLLQRGATHIYTDYWTCNRIAFQSNERIICSVLDSGLQPGLNRYPPYRSLVSADPHAFYVFPSASPQDTRFSLRNIKLHYQHSIFAGYAIYQPPN